MTKCNKCNDRGEVPGPLGIMVKCSCQISGGVKSKDIKLERPIYHVTKADKIVVMTKKLIPDARINDEYDEKELKENIGKICKSQGCKVRGFGDYSEALNEVLVGVSTGTLNKSYLLGAPNGFGKTTFANTCIKRLDASGFKAVPFISLFELAELRMEHERALLGYNRKQEQKGNEDVEEVKYRWSDYAKSTVLFTYLTTLDNKKVEASVLKAIMDIRGPKGLPTIVFTSSSLVPYLSDNMQKKVVWDDILSYNDEDAKCSRLIHRSCYKIYNNSVVIAGNQ